MKKLLPFLSLYIVFNTLCFTNSAFSQQWQWGRGAGGAGNDQGKAISTDANGNSYTTGRFTDVATFGTLSATSYGGPDIYVSKYDTYGNCLWVKHGGSIDASDVYGDEGDGIDIDVNGNAYVTGNFKTVATFGTLTLSCPVSKREIFVVKYDSSGNEIWARQPTGNMSNNYSRAITVDASGNSYITGYLGGGTNTFGTFTISGAGAFVVKYDSSGTAIYATKLATFGGIDAYGISVDAAGNAYVTGYLQGTDSINGVAYTSTGDRDAFLIKVDASGNFAWFRQSQSIPGTYAYGNGVAVDRQGNALMTGYFDNVIQFGATVLQITTAGGGECFIAKYNASGNIIWAKQSHSGRFALGTSGLAITSDSSSNAVITGSDGGDTVAFGTHVLPDNGRETFVALYDSSGNCNWALASTGQNPGAFGNGISTDNNGGYYVTGFYKGPPVFGNDTLPTYSGEDILVAKIGNPFVQANYTTANTSICPGSCISFTNLSLQATSYQWSFPGGNPSSSTTANPVVCYDSTGTFDVQLIAMNGLLSDTLTLTNYITVFAAPVVPLLTQSGDTLFATGGYAGYQWYFDSVLISGATNYFYVATQSGNYNVVVINENGCAVGAGIVNVIAEEKEFNVQSLMFKVFPNPAKNNFTLAIFNSPLPIVNLEILNPLGEIVYSEKLIGKNEYTLHPNLSQGIYFVRVSNGEKSVMMKLVVE